MSGSDALGVAGLVISIVGLLVTIIGFALAIIQLSRTAKASVATTKAVESANQRMLYNHLLVLLPSMRTLVGDLDVALARRPAPDKPAVVRALVNFSFTANQVAALLETDAKSHTELASELRRVARDAGSVKAEILYGTTTPLTDLLRVVVSDISHVASRCAGLTTTYQTRIA